MSVVIACGSRTALDTSSHDAGSPDVSSADAHTPGYKVVFVDRELPAPAVVWHSSDTLSSIALTDSLYDASPSFTYDGRFAVTGRLVGDQCEVDVVDASGTPVVRLASPPKWVWYEPSLRPDGRRVLLGAGALNAGGTDLVSIDLDGGVSTVMHGSGADFARSAMYAPDGKTIAFVHYMFGDTQQIETIREDGTDRRVIVPTPEDGRSVRSPSFSFDGSSIVYLKCDQHPLCELDLVDLSSLASTTLAQSLIMDASPRFTPDGSGVVYVDLSCASRCNRLMRLDVETKTIVELVDVRRTVEFISLAVDQ